MKSVRFDKKFLGKRESAFMGRKKFILTIFILAAAFLFPVKCLCDDYAESEIYLRERNIFPDGGADEFITRAEFLKMTVMSLDKNIGFFGTSFNDISKDNPYYKYISFAEHEGIINGTESGFMPDIPISRQDAAVMLMRAYHIDGAHYFNISKYPDGIYISDYALSAMAYMSSEGIINGDERGIRPLDRLTNAEAVRIIYRIMKTGGEKTEYIAPVFEDGYPKLRADGISGGFNIVLKTTSECNVYYTLTSREYSVLDRVFPEDFLVSVTEGGSEINVYIPASEDKTFSIYFCTVDKHGNRSREVCIKNAIPHPYSAGSGTESDPYIISNEKQLYSVRHFPNKAFRLKNDMVISGNWEPIGDAKEPFCGIFDGAGFTISGFSADGGEYGGLFGLAEGGCIKNLHVKAEKIICAERAGVIAGETSGTVIENCLAEGLVKADVKNGGGICGINGGIIRNSMSAVTAVSAGNYSGGICGKNTGTIDGCLSAVYHVKADIYAGGIAGINEGGIITNNCAINMNITDEMAKNSGRITTNRRNGVLENNYSYDLTYASNTSDGGKNSINGAYTSIEELSSEAFYKTKAGWDFSKYWRAGDENYLIPTLSMFDRPDTEKGLTVYAPIPVYTKEDLISVQDNPSAHYALMNDIEAGNIKPICADPDNGFSGSIDGRGHSLSGIRLEYNENENLFGLFGYITGGFIKNIRAENIYVSGNDITGGFAGVNYGILSDITMRNAQIRADQITGGNVTVGAIAAVNYGTIKNCEVRADINVRGSNITAGIISGYNEGVISRSLASGRINASGYEDSSAAAGGICGFNSSILSELFSDAAIKAKSRTAYLGGIAGMSDGGEIYKSSALGSIDFSKTSGKVYAGGIFALGSGMKLSHCHTRTGINISAEDIYAGGIGGYNLKSNIQNSYSRSKLRINASNEGFSGGIAGVNEDGFLNSDVSASEIITDNKSGRITALTSAGGAGNNYALGDKKETASQTDGIPVSAAELRTGKFYFTPVADGGKLGWQNIYDGGDVWKWGGEINPSYSWPLLENTPGQEYFALYP
ncbi:MAG: S-layer homology domain-containing protein [Oscillospiraceae bacterium]|nr:S-layer homology domain-containing protein [Oscillospiraceae bacterium]